MEAPSPHDLPPGWKVTVASDVSGPDRLGWELSHGNRLDQIAWSIFREDGGPFPIFIATATSDLQDLRAPIRALTAEAVADLLVRIRIPDPVGWHVENIAAALMLVTDEIISWDGNEWALESDADDNPTRWTTADDPRIPFHQLRCRTAQDDVMFGTYQDDGVFGLAVSSTDRPAASHIERSEGILRTRTNVDLATGSVRRVAVVLDTSVTDLQGDGLLTEMLIECDSARTLLIAAEAYSVEDWRLYDESVVAVADPVAADSLLWSTRRTPWFQHLPALDEPHG